jgi:hypothetical protein
VSTAAAHPRSPAERAAKRKARRVREMLGPNPMRHGSVSSSAIPLVESVSAQSLSAELSASRLGRTIWLNRALPQSPRASPGD